MPLRAELELAGYRSDWLDRAEISSSGLSFFFYLKREFLEFCQVAGLPEVLAEDEALRRRYPLQPRYWVKLSERGVSRYYVVQPELDYPSTTLRLLLHRFGATRREALESALQPALTAPGTSWAVIAKPEYGCVSCGIRLDGLGALLDSMTAQGYVTERVAREHQSWSERLAGDPKVYVTLDPDRTDAVAVDYFLPRWPENPPRFLKCRLDPSSLEPEWSCYYPFKEAEQTGLADRIGCAGARARPAPGRRSAPSTPE